MPIVPVDESLDVKQLVGDSGILWCDARGFPSLVYFHVHLAKVDVRAGALRVSSIECCVAEIPVRILCTILDYVGECEHFDSVDFHEGRIPVDCAWRRGGPLIWNARSEPSSGICSSA